MVAEEAAMLDSMHTIPKIVKIFIFRVMALMVQLGRQILAAAVVDLDHMAIGTTTLILLEELVDLV